MSVSRPLYAPGARSVHSFEDLLGLPIYAAEPPVHEKRAFGGGNKKILK